MVTTNFDQSWGDCGWLQGSLFGGRWLAQRWPWLWERVGTDRWWASLLPDWCRLRLRDSVCNKKKCGWEVRNPTWLMLEWHNSIQKHTAAKMFLQTLLQGADATAAWHEWSEVAVKPKIARRATPSQSTEATTSGDLHPTTCDCSHSTTDHKCACTGARDDWCGWWWHSLKQMD